MRAQFEAANADKLLMSESTDTTQRLAVIMFTDMVGFSRMTAEDPLRTRRLNETHHQMVSKCINQSGGTIRQTTGDGYFVEFASAVAAVECAFLIQTQIRERNANVPKESQFQIRIGIHTGEIFEKNQEIFGQTINIAARLEPIASAGGICISKSVYNLLQESPFRGLFKSIGIKELKNIKDALEIFEFVQSDETSVSKKEYFLESLKKIKHFWRHEASLSFFVLAVLSLFFMAVMGWTFSNQNITNAKRWPAMISTSYIDSSWQISFSDDQWRDYDAKKNWAYADVVNGPVFLRNEFVVDTKPKSPMLILGLLGDEHKVYVNGYYVGGSDHLSQLAVYPIDPQILKLSPDVNQIEVKSQTRKSLNPGLVEVAQIKPQLTEASVVQEMQSEYFFRFFVLRSIFFAFSAFVFLLSVVLLFYLKDRHDIIYSSLFLILGAFHYIYYNPYFNSLFEYPLMRSIRLNSILLSSFVLAAAFYHLAGKIKTSRVHLGLGVLSSFLVFGCFASGWVPLTSEKFVSLYNSFLTIGLLYTLLLTSHLLTRNLDLFQKIQHQKSLVLATLALHICSYLGAFKYSTSTALFSGETRMWFGEIGLALPFVFALCRVLIAAMEMGQNKLQNEQILERQNAQLALAEILTSSETSLVRAKAIFLRTSTYFKATRAQLLMGDSQQFTIIESIRPGAMPNVQQQVKSQSGYSRGILKYVETTGQGLAVQNINNDTRFVSEDSSYVKAESARKYTTNSCLVVPLKFDNRVCGFLTFTDRKIAEAFTESDLAVALYAASLISILIQVKSTGSSSRSA